MIRLPALFKALAAAAATMLGAAPALAHHPMGGTLPGTAWQGLASGLGHPVIEVDHLLFLLGAAAVAALTRATPARAGAALILYAIAASLGTLARVGEISLPMGGPAVALSLMAVGVCLWLQRGPSGIAGGLTAAAAGADRADRLVSGWTGDRSVGPDDRLLCRPAAPGSRRPVADRDRGPQPGRRDRGSRCDAAVGWRLSP